MELTEARIRNTPQVITNKYDNQQQVRPPKKPQDIIPFNVTYRLQDAIKWNKQNILRNKQEKQSSRKVVFNFTGDWKQKIANTLLSMEYL